MFLEWNAEKYSKRLSKRIRDGIDTSIANGMFCGGKVPFGYRLEVEQIADNAKPIKKVVVYDDDTVVFFNLRGGKDIEKLTIDDTKEAVNSAKGVRTQTSPLHH